MVLYKLKCKRNTESVSRPATRLLVTPHSLNKLATRTLCKEAASALFELSTVSGGHTFSIEWCLSLLPRESVTWQHEGQWWQTPTKVLLCMCRARFLSRLKSRPTHPLFLTQMPAYHLPLMISSKLNLTLSPPPIYYTHTPKHILAIYIYLFLYLHWPRSYS